MDTQLSLSIKNKLDITPINIAKKTHTYYMGLFDLTKRLDQEVDRSPKLNAIEDYFPLIIDAFNRRGNWKNLTTKEAITTDYFDFCWSNIEELDGKSSIHSRIVLDSVDHYISDKKAFYEKYKGEDFVPDYMAVSKKTLADQKDCIDKKYDNVPVIVKPDLGTMGKNILVQTKYNFDELRDHINNSSYDNWTISTVYVSKIINNYINTCRTYFLVTKETKTTTKNQTTVNGYYYTHFMNYRADEEFSGDITSKEQFLTNYYDHTDPNNDINFVKHRFIPNKVWRSNFSEDELAVIFSKLDHAFAAICNGMRNDILCANDTADIAHKTGFHIYGADVVVTKDLQVKILELNGAPAMNIKTRLYNVIDRLDYFDMLDDFVELVVDTVHPPSDEFKKTRENLFKKVYSGDTAKNTAIGYYYIGKKIIKSYPFIYNAIKKRPYLKRTNNPSGKLDILYGLRERYVTQDTSMQYYDEILNYITSKNMRNTPIINKIQGITYYMANKGRLYEKLKWTVGHDKFHPRSIVLYYKTYEQAYDKIIDYINQSSHKKCIIKPVHGSRGLGIDIFDVSAKNIDGVIKHMQFYNDIGTSVLINGVDTNVKYNYWILSDYIDNPHLLSGKKYNIRFYALLVINGKLPTYQNLTNLINGNTDVMELYIFNDCLIYTALLQYNNDITNIPEEFADVSPELIHKMRNLTNLEFINKLFQMNKIENTEKYKIENTMLMSRMFGNSNFGSIIMSQGINIMTKVVESVRYDLRSLNRHVTDYKCAFNLLAFDTMLDDIGNLWFIEVNRGPDLVGLHLQLGDKACTDIFDEIFGITIDRYYNCGNSDGTYFTKIPIHYDVC